MVLRLFPGTGFSGAIDLEPFLQAQQYWNISSHFMNSLVVATLSAILSCQIAAILSDLLQGVKQQNQTTIAAINTRLLAASPSLLAISDALFRNDSITSVRFPKSAMEGYVSRGRTRVTLKNVFTLFALVLVGPVPNILIIVLTTERQEILMLSSEVFGGFALGFSSDAFDRYQEFGSCFSVPTLAPSLFTIHLEFLRCVHYYKAETIPSTGVNHSVIELNVTRSASVRAEYTHPVDGFENETKKHTFEFSGALSTEEGVFRVGHRITPEDVRRVLVEAIKKIPGRPIIRVKVNVEDMGLRPVAESFAETVRNENLKLSERIVEMSDARYDANEVNAAIAALFFGTLYDALNFVNADRILLSRLEGITEGDRKIEFRDNIATNIPFVRWRKKILSELNLVIVVSTSVLIHVATRLLTNNDIESGTERVLKSYLGVPQGYQLLWNQEEVTYDNVYVLENQEMLYGVERKHLREWKRSS